MGKQEEFIFSIQPYITTWKQLFGFGVVSAIIAQACHESGYGTSDKAQHNNYFGLKYKGNRVTCNSGKFTSTSFEYKDGVRYPIVTEWYEFPDMNTGVQGYFQFINSGNYAKAKTATTPEGYLQALKDTGYATGPNYVENCMKVVNTYNLTQFDGGSMSYHVDPNRKPDSPLALKAMWTDNCTYPRQTKKKPSSWTIIPHCTAGNSSAEATARSFQNPARQASSHYIIDSNGIIIQNVPEDCRAWTTGGDLNVNGLTGAMMDHESITIEVANCALGGDWPMSAAAINSLVLLMTDICKRNGIPRLNWSGNKFLAGTDKQNVAAHRWFARKACPGNFLYNNMGAVCDTVNMLLAAGPAPTPAPSNGYFINGLDFSPVFNPQYYRTNNPDVAASPYGVNDDTLWDHFCNFGMNELRQGSSNFNAKAYKDRYSDLRDAFGDDNFEYYQHYVRFGIAEGRNAL